MLAGAWPTHVWGGGCHVQEGVHELLAGVVIQLGSGLFCETLSVAEKGKRAVRIIQCREDDE